MKLASRTTGWIGIDVGGACVKTAQAVRRGGAYYIRSAAAAPRRERWSPEALASAPAPAASADEMLAAASICERLTGRAAAAVFPMALCETLQVEAPQSPRRRDRDLAALVAAETHQSLACCVLGSWPAPLQPGRINVITAPARWSDQITADVAAGRWNCRAIDALPWALARAARMAAAPGVLPTTIVLDWGVSRATMCLVHEGAPAIVRCLKDCGFSRTMAAVQRSLGLFDEDAELVLRRQGISRSSERGEQAETALDDALAEPLQALEGELRRTLGFWQGQTRCARPDRMYVFGAGASLPGIDGWLATALELDVRRWSLPTELAGDERRLPPAHLLGPALAASALAWEAS